MKRIRPKAFKRKQDVKPERVTPSVYAQERLQSTEGRLKKIDQHHHKWSSVDTDQLLFQPYPSELVFQNFTPAQTYKLPLKLYNKDKVSQQVMLERQNSEYFSVVAPEGAGGRTAPGLTVTYTVLFTPQENKDYHHRLVFVTERERFEVPIRAIGPRAILDFRDEVRFPVQPVKASTERTQLVRNIGNSKAEFKLDTQSPFSVTPSCGSLDVGESMQVTVEFNPMTTGDHKQDLHLHYRTGEDVYISLHGACKEQNIRLESDTVVYKTYISLANNHRVSLTYESEIPLKYYWTTWPSLQEEALSLLRESSVLQQIGEEEREQLLVQCESDPTAIHRLPLLSRTLHERRSQAVDDYRLTLSDSCITVEPAEGEIWPRVPAQFSIVFKPKEAKLYQQTIYCDITGREARLPLTIKAEGMGPNLRLDYDLMNMKNVVIGDTDYYEVKVNNRGLIDAPFRLSSPDTTFGRCFSFSPEEGVVPSEARQVVKVTFHSHVLGTFSEDLLLTVTGQPQPLTVTFRGCVIAPPFHFNVFNLDFGVVAFGFPQTLTCTLINTSFVPIKFALRLLGDGSGSPSVSSAKQVSNLSRNNWEGSAARGRHAWPVEFTITPAVGTVRSRSDITIKVTLCSNTVKTYYTALAVDVEGVGKEIRILPINARCVVPDIVVETPVLDFQKCFLNHPYEQKLRLTNTSTVPACYGMLDQQYEERLPLFFCSTTPRGVILPNSSEELPVLLQAKAAGRQLRTLRIAVFGSVQRPLEVVVSCVGQGPIVHIDSPQLDFGTIPVLTDITRVLHLSNQSPIPAHFTARISHGKSLGHVDPSEGQILAEKQLELNVVAHLKAAIHYQARLEVSIQDSETYTVPLSATGSGTTIVSDKPFAPNLDLGTHLSHRPCQYHFKFTNVGKQVHRMYWQTDNFLPSTKSQKGRFFSCRTVLPPISAPGKKAILGPGPLPSCSSEKPVFSLMPSHVELFPGCSADMVLTGSSDSPKLVQERLLCHGIVGGQGCSKLLMTVDVTCRFVDPTLSMSSKQLEFYIEKIPEKSLMPQYEKLILENMSSLPLSMELSLVEPFSLCEASGAYSPATTKSMVLGDRRKAELWVCFNPSFGQDQESKVVDEFLKIHYQGHPQQDMVRLHAEVHFPNLHFSSTTVDFGCVLNCSGARKGIFITNCSKLPVSYDWAFLDDQKPCRETETEQKHPPAFSVGVQEVFDIWPIYGDLSPGDQQMVLFCFSGEEDVSREVVALCRVADGPTYEVRVRGETSVVSYSLSTTHIDFGQRIFDHEVEAELTLKNTGKIGFKFIITHSDEEAEGQTKALNGQKVRPGRPKVIPSTDYIHPGAEYSLRVIYLPGIPEVFETRLQLVGDLLLGVQDIRLTGEGVFPRVSLDLPQNMPECNSDVMLQAREAVVAKDLMDGTVADGGAAEAKHTLTFEELVQMEAERILVKQNALTVTNSRLERRGSSSKCHRLGQFLLPEYILDFGFVIPGEVLHRTVNVTNTGSVAVSFHAEDTPLAGTGYSVEFKRVKDLPCGKTKAFTVEFDPKGANVRMGVISAVLVIKVTCGPMVQVRLRAVVTVPSVTVSTDAVQLGTVQCGMCQMTTIRLFNNECVSCYWSITEWKKSLKQQAHPVVFKIIPSSGMLSPGELVNIKIKFSPAEGRAYNWVLVVRVAESTQQRLITVMGQGEEPQLEFCPSVLQLGPCLPATTEPEADITVKNPCSFPIEFYSLEFDTQYIEEEKILRLMQGYDEDNILLLPPRAPGESLPTELLDYYSEYCSQLTDHDSFGHTSSSSTETKMTPVSRAIARHMCVYPSPEELAARNRRGIAIIVYGAPLTDKSSTAAALALHYGGALLRVDAVVTEVLINGTSPVSLTARQLYDCAAAKYAEEAAQTTESGPAAHPEASEPAPDTDSNSKALQETEKTHFALCLGGDVTTLSDLLPEQLLVDILAERFQQSDCYRGIVIDGLESVYTQSVASTLQVVLKALNDRKHIYVVNLSDSYDALKAREKAQRETEEALQKEKDDKEEQWLQEMDGEKYDALPEEEKDYIDKLFEKHELRERERKAKEEDEKRREEERKRLEEELKKNSGNNYSEASLLEEGQPIVDELWSEFSSYEHIQEQVEQIVQNWDRAQGLLLNQTPGPMEVESLETPAEAEVIIIPHIVLTVGNNCPCATELLKGSTLPPLVEVLEDLGLGPSGPPIPPPSYFSVVPFPKNREQADLTCRCFTFLDPYEQGKERVKKGPNKKKRQTPRRSRASLTTFRWTVPACGETVLRIRFSPDAPGTFHQELNFELQGTQRRYQLPCSGICTI